METPRQPSSPSEPTASRSRLVTNQIGEVLLGIRLSLTAPECTENLVSRAEKTVDIGNVMLGIRLSLTAPECTEIPTVTSKK